MTRGWIIIVATVVAYALLLFAPGSDRIAGGFAGMALVLAMQEWFRPRHGVTAGHDGGAGR